MSSDRVTIAAQEIHDFVRALIAPWPDFRGHENQFAAIISRHFPPASAPASAECPECGLTIRHTEDCPLRHAPPAQSEEDEARRNLVRQFNEWKPTPTSDKPQGHRPFSAETQQVRDEDSSNGHRPLESLKERLAGLAVLLSEAESGSEAGFDELVREALARIEELEAENKRQLAERIKSERIELETRQVYKEAQATIATLQAENKRLLDELDSMPEAWSKVATLQDKLELVRKRLQAIPCVLQGVMAHQDDLARAIIDARDILSEVKG